MMTSRRMPRRDSRRVAIAPVTAALLVALHAGCSAEHGCGNNIVPMLDLTIVSDAGEPMPPTSIFVTPPGRRRLDVREFCVVEPTPHCSIEERGDGGTYLVEVSVGDTHVSRSVEIGHTEDGCHLETVELTLQLPAP